MVTRDGWGQFPFSFFSNKNLLYLLWVPLVGLQGLVWGFSVGCGGLFGGEVEGLACQMHPFWVWIAWSVLGADALSGSSLSRVFCLGRVPCLVLGLESASVVLERDSEQV